MIIDCRDCEMHETEHCEDCFVMALLAPRNRPVVIDPEEEEAFTNLQDAGLAPPLKFRRRAGGPAEGPAEGAAGEPRPRKKPGRGVLTPKEIQAELRSGKSVQEVAELAGTDTSWIERFLSPILAERKGIVDSVMTGVISRPRQGRSSCNVGQAIVANLKDRKVAISPDDLEEGWSVARRKGQWEVTFRYSLRGQEKQAQFAYDPDGGVTAMDAEASVIGWRPPASRHAGGAEGGP